MHALTLRRLPGRFAMLRLGPADAIPPWALRHPTPFTSLTRTGGELSLIVAQESVPDGVHADPGWHCLAIDARFDLDVPGVANSVLAPLSGAGHSVFVVATFDTDHFLVRDVDGATAVLEAAGHRVLGSG